MRRNRDRDRLHLLRMRDAAQLAQEVVQTHQRSDLDNDRFFQLGLAKAVERVGESASHISDELLAEQPQIPWRKIISMRHVLVHNYWQVELDVVWETVQRDIPPLIAQLQRLIETEDERRNG